jgi:hypothetical protein
LIAAKSLRGIFAPVAAFSFSPGQFDDCETFLANRSANTERIPIVDERQLRMAADGRLVETGYRFNSLGFSALSSALAVGLNPLFQELSGENARMRTIPTQEFDLAAAVSVYNTTLGVRFDAVRERGLLVDSVARSVDGFLGLDHKFLDNSRFWHIVCDEISEKQPDAVFYRAEIIGRELRLYFMNPKSRLTDIFPDAGHSFAAGWCFSNREDTGKAVRANSCLFTRFGLAVAPSSTKLSHMGADLEGRTAIMISKAVEKELDMAVISKRLRALARTSLNFSSDGASFKTALNHWISYLGRFKLSQEDAKRVVKNAASVGSDIAPRDVMDAYTGDSLRARNGYDLFCALLKVAKNEYQTQRDLLQSVAMQLLVPNVKAKK